MKRLLAVLIAVLAIAGVASSQTIGSGVVLGDGVQIGGVALTPVQPNNSISFSPIGGTYIGQQSITLSTTASSDSMFYTLDGSDATEASALYSSSFLLSTSANINVLAIAPPTVTAQSIHQCSTGSCWTTQLACTADVSSTACQSNYNAPGITPCATAGGCGVQGIPTAINYITGVSSPSISGSATHINFTTQDLPGAGTSTSVLFENIQPSADSATYQVEDFYQQPAEGLADMGFTESDLVSWNATRGLILEAGLQCNVQTGQWQYGAGGTWHPFVNDWSGSPLAISKNGDVFTGSGITESCGTSASGWAHIQYHATFNPGKLDCTDATTSSPTECVYIDYLEINGNQYAFGTASATNLGGQTITVSALKVPASALPGGSPSRCFSQFELSGQGTSASPSRPVTYGEYYDQVNMSCGAGAPDATNAQQYTITIPNPTGMPVTFSATASSNANASNGDNPSRKQLTNCAEGWDSTTGQLKPIPPAGETWPKGELYCTAAEQAAAEAAGGPTEGVITDNTTGTIVGTVGNGKNAGGVNSPTVLVTGYAGTANDSFCTGDVQYQKLVGQVVQDIAMPPCVPNSSATFGQTTVTGHANADSLWPTSYNAPIDSSLHAMRVMHFRPSNVALLHDWETDTNHNTSKGWYNGWGGHWNETVQFWQACPQGCNGWKSEKWCAVDGSGCITKYPLTSNHVYGLAFWFSRTDTCTPTSTTSCYMYDYAMVWDVTTGEKPKLYRITDLNGNRVGGIPQDRHTWSKNLITPQYQIDGTKAGTSTIDVDSDTVLFY